MLLKKAARCHLLLTVTVVRCLFHNLLRLKRSSLLNVYLNCKFEISLLSSHFFLGCSIRRFSYRFPSVDFNCTHQIFSTWIFTVHFFSKHNFFLNLPCLTNPNAPILQFSWKQESFCVIKESSWIF